MSSISPVSKLPHDQLHVAILVSGQSQEFLGHCCVHHGMFIGVDKVPAPSLMPARKTNDLCW